MSRRNASGRRTAFRAFWIDKPQTSAALTQRVCREPLVASRRRWRTKLATNEVSQAGPSEPTVEKVEYLLDPVVWSQDLARRCAREWRSRDHWIRRLFSSAAPHSTSSTKGSPHSFMMGHIAVQNHKEPRFIQMTRLFRRCSLSLARAPR
jgi:hypothetical protein